MKCAPISLIASLLPPAVSVLPSFVSVPSWRLYHRPGQAAGEDDLYLVGVVPPAAPPHQAVHQAGELAGQRVPQHVGPHHARHVLHHGPLVLLLFILLHLIVLALQTLYEVLFHLLLLFLLPGLQSLEESAAGPAGGRSSALCINKIDSNCGQTETGTRL